VANTATTYGSCWSCVSDLASPGTFVTGNRAIAEAIARRLQTPRGGLIDDPTYGYDLTDFVDADVSPADLARMQSNVVAECLKDERVSGASVSVLLTAAGVMIATIKLEPVGGQPFTLVLSVSAVAVDPVTILGVSQ
jgi:phage baseplate assembly protein W